jgi:Arc/MetJ-type ribon-helix-helix transcriptional regulator
MSLSEIEQEALKLPTREKADLVRKLLEAMPAEAMDISDEEILERERKLERGEIEELSHDEFVRRVRSERGR